jgi:hypothetical protein
MIDLNLETQIAEQSAHSRCYAYNYLHTYWATPDIMFCTASGSYQARSMGLGGVDSRSRGQSSPKLEPVPKKSRSLSE